MTKELFFSLIEYSHNTGEYKRFWILKDENFNLFSERIKDVVWKYLNNNEGDYFFVSNSEPLKKEDVEIIIKNELYENSEIWFFKLKDKKSIEDFFNSLEWAAENSEIPYFYIGQLFLGYVKVDKVIERIN